MTDLNLYASKVFGEHPLAVWSLDGSIGTATSFPQYSSNTNPAFVSLKCSQGVPMVYGSKQSVRLANLGGEPIEEVIDRLWEDVQNDPDTLQEETWAYWKDKMTYRALLNRNTYVDGGTYIPSIKYDSYGMFTNEGKFNTYTSEAWIRIDCRSSSPVKIWGTVNTYDGLWVNDNYLTLVVGGENKSYAVENWYRPMLVNVTYSPTQARLVVNGQEVIVLNYIADDVDFTSLDPDLDNQTGFLGFALGGNIKLYEVDCISLYSYIVPDDVLKRRFVWGQGVRGDNKISTAYDTQITYADYPYSEYSNNVLYPDLYNWSGGYMNNLTNNLQSLTTPSFDLPEIFINGRNRDALYSENLQRQLDNKETFFTFQPEFDWDQPSYFYFNSVNALSEPVQAIYVSFEIDSGMIDPSNLVNEPLMVFRKSNGDSFIISTYGDNVRYTIVTNGVETMVTNPNIGYDIPASVGVDINEVLHSLDTSTELKRFFSSVSDLELFVGGDGANTFSGLIYNVGFADTSSFSRNDLSPYFNDKGFVDGDMKNVISSYTLVPRFGYGEFYLDVAAHCYWEDSIALTVLGKNIKQDDNYVPALNMFQLNIGHDGTYEFDSQEFYDFSKSELQAYIGFQRVSDNVQKSITDYPDTDYLYKSRVVRPDSEWETTKYSVMNGTVIYPPVGIPYEELKVIVYFDVKAENVVHSPFAIKNLSFASQCYLDRADVGTLFGTRFTSVDPFAIYKEGSPYLYLTKDSGIEPLDDGTISIPFNENRAATYPVNMITAWVKPDFKNFNDGSLIDIVVDGVVKASLSWVSDVANSTSKMFNIVSSDEDLLEYVKINKNDIVPTVANGPIMLEDNQWAFVGVEFPLPIYANGMEGETTLHSGAVYQNINLTKVSLVGLSAAANVRTWGELPPNNWGYWSNEVLDYRALISSDSYFNYQVTPIDAFDIYSGNNGFIVDDTSNINIEQTKGSILINVDWATYDRQPS